MREKLADRRPSADHLSRAASAKGRIRRASRCAAQEAVARKQSGKKRAGGFWLAGCGMLLALLVASMAKPAQAQIFGTPQNLSNNPGESGIDQLVVMGSNIYVVWSE